MSRSLKTAFLIIGVVFVIFFIGMYHFVRTAFLNYEPPVEEGYYEKGLDYQKRVSEFNRAKAAGWSMQVNLLEATNLSKGPNPLTIQLRRDASKPAPVNGPEDAGRLAATVTVSHRSSTIGSHKFEFTAGDFQRKGPDLLELSRSVEIPLTGKVEIAVEVRPTADSAIYQAKTLKVE